VDKNDAKIQHVSNFLAQLAELIVTVAALLLILVSFRTGLFWKC